MNNLDRAVNNDFLVVTKSLLPYLNVDRQKPVAIFIKVLELLYTVNLFSNETSVHSLSRGQEAGWENDFLRDVKDNLSEDKAYFIDVLMKLTEAKNLLSHPEAYSENKDKLSPDAYHMHPADSGILEHEPFPDTQPNKVPPPTSNPKASSVGNTTMQNPEQMIKALSSMLDPNQAQLVKLLSSLLTPQKQGGQS